jgi:hypothetical protein
MEEVVVAVTARPVVVATACAEALAERESDMDSEVR